MARSRKLKVFQAQLGFYDTVVAAPNQAAALAAWGVHQNLFASGEARVVTDAKTVEAAHAHPGELLRRVAGSNDPFERNPTALPAVPAPHSRKAKAAKPPPPERTRPPPDRSELDRAEAALDALEADRLREEAAFERDAEALEARRAAAQQAYVDAHKAAKARLGAAKAAYRKAGGGD